MTGRDAWKTSSRLIRKAAAKKAAAKKAAAKKAAARAEQQAAANPATGPGTTGPTVAPNGVILSLKNVAGATLTVDTQQGKFSLPIDRLADGSAVSLLDNRVTAQRGFAHAPLFEGANQQDFPAAAADAEGTGVWVAAVWHEPRGPELMPAVREQLKDFAGFQPTGGGDQVRLLHFQNGKAGEPLDVTPPGRDVWRPAVAKAGDGSIVVVWTEKRDDNWDLFSRRYDPAKSRVRARAAHHRSGRFRQRRRPHHRSERHGLARLASVESPARPISCWSHSTATARPAAPPLKISDTPANEWAPSIAADSSGRVHVAFDTYQAGDYDVLLRTREADGTLSPAITVAGTSWFEARPSVAVDSRGRAWIAYEERTPNWGKDAVNLLDGKGSSLYRSSKVVVKVVDGRRVLDAPDPLENARRRSQDDEQLSPARRRSRQPSVARVPPSHGGDLGQQRRDGHRSRLDRPRHITFGLRDGRRRAP